MKMQAFFTTKQKSIANGNPVSNELEDGNDFYEGSYDDPSVPLLRQGKAEQTGAEKLGVEATLFPHSHVHAHTPPIRPPFHLWSHLPKRGGTVCVEMLFRCLSA